MAEQEAWVEGFKERLRVNTFEQFSVLMCDLEKCDKKQKDLLRPIIFEDHKCVNNWGKYIDYAIAAFPDRKRQLHRLLNKSLQMLENCDLKDNEEYVRIHLESAKLKE